MDGRKVSRASGSPCSRAWVGLGTRQGCQGEETKERVGVGRWKGLEEGAPHPKFQAEPRRGRASRFWGHQVE